MPDYFSLTFNSIYKKNDTDDIFGFEAGTIYELLDCIFINLEIDYDTFKYSFRPPKNVLITSTKDTIRFFVGGDKAITQLNVISVTTKMDDKLCSMNEANEIGQRQFGFSYDIFIDIDRKSLNLMIPYIKLLGSKTISEKTKIFPKELLNSINYAYKNDDEDSLASLEKQLPKIIFYATILKARKQVTMEIEEKTAMNINPRFKARDIVINPNQCFYVMDFHDDDVQEMYNALSDELMNRLGIRVIKSGDIFKPDRQNEMVENIWQDILGSRLVIADISCKNPNVFYELGICDTIGKKVIPLCSEYSYENHYERKFPFDIQQEHTIIYKTNFSGTKKAVDTVSQMVDAIINNKSTIVER